MIHPVIADVSFIWNHAYHRTLQLLPWFLLAVVLGGLLQHLRIDVLTKGSLRRRSMAAAASTAFTGALTPFCACSIVPLVRSFLVAGVPVSVVMAFWIASPAMAPEIFALTASAFGAKIAVARLVGAIVLAIGASLAARVMERRGWFRNVLRDPPKPASTEPEASASEGCCTATAEPAASSMASSSMASSSVATSSMATALVPVGALATGERTGLITLPPVLIEGPAASGDCCASPAMGGRPAAPAEEQASCCGPAGQADAVDPGPEIPWHTMAKESLQQANLWDYGRDLGRSSWKMGRWMLLGILIEALVVRFVSPHAFDAILGGNVLTSVLVGALLSIPLYLNGVSAIPIGASLVAVGLNPAGLVTFMLAGAITTIPAMAGVRAVVHRNIFMLYLTTGVLGSIIVGLLAAPLVG